MDYMIDYNQIQTVLKRHEVTTFWKPKYIFCYKVMPFGLKNTGAIYQRVVQTTFEDNLQTRMTIKSVFI